MSEQVLSAEDLDGLWAYLDDCGRKKGCKIALGKVKHASLATPADVALGRDLFDGTRKLAKGGPSCLSCHNVRGAGLLGGGTLAKDLTFAYARLGDAGLQSSLETTPFNLMKDVFARRPLTPEEAFALKAYLADIARDGTPPAADRNFLYLGVIGLFAAFGTIGAIWSGRMKGSTRAAIVERGRP